jgi:hypothetical protein
MSPSAATTPTTAANAHIDIYDHASRARWAELLGVTDERLRKAVRIVGTRVSSVSAYLAK